MKKFLLLLTVLLTGLLSASAEEYTLALKPTGVMSGDANSATGKYEDSATGTQFEVTLNKSNCQTDINLTYEELRVYKDAELTITAPEGMKISKLIFTTAKNTSDVTVNGKTYTKSGTNVTIDLGSDNAANSITLKSTGGQNRFTKVVITATSSTPDTRTAVTLSWNSTSASATLNQADFKAPTLTADPDAALSEVKYTSTKPEVASIDETTGVVTLGTKAGSTTIKAAIEGNETYKDAKAEYVLTVTDPNAKNYTLITDIKDLYDGATGVIVGNTPSKGYMALGAQSGTIRNETSVTINGTEVIDPKNAAIITFHKVGDNYTLEAEDGYFSHSGSGNSIATGTTQASTIITFETSGTVNIKIDGKDRILRYNSGSSRFAFYGSSYTSGSAMYLYIMPNPSGKEKANLSFPEPSYSVNQGDAFNAPEIVNPNKIEGITYESNAPEVAEVDPATGAVTIKGIGVATITAKSAETDKYLEGSASYTITVNGAVDNLADFIALGSKYDVTLTANFTSTVTYANGSHIYLTDGENYGYMYMSNLNLKDGDVIPEGWKGKITIFNTTTVEITNVTGIAAEGLENKPVNPTAVTSISTDMENQYVVVYGVEFENGITTTTDNKTFTGLLGSQEIKCYNRDGLEDVPAGYYEVKGIVTVYQGNPQITISHLWANPEKPVFQGTAEGSEWPSELQEGMVLTWTVKYGTLSYVDNNQQPSQVAAYAAEANTAWNVSADGKTITYTVPDDTKGINYSIINTVNGVKSEEAKLIVGEDGSVSGVQDVVIDNAPAVYYNLQGVRVEGDRTPGLYILRQGNTTTQVIVR